MIIRFLIIHFILLEALGGLVSIFRILGLVSKLILQVAPSSMMFIFFLVILKLLNIWN